MQVKGLRMQLDRGTLTLLLISPEHKTPSPSYQRSVVLPADHTVVEGLVYSAEG